MSSEIDERLTKLENKIDLVLQQQQATQRAIAHLKADIPETTKESMHSVLNKRAMQGYSRISS
jgi:hypothetical protein